MSQPSSPFHGIDADSPLTAFHHQPLTRGNLEDLFASSEPDQPTFSSKNSEILDFPFDDTSAPSIYTAAAPIKSASDFEQHHFGNALAAYPASKSNSPHSYSNDTWQSLGVFENQRRLPGNDCAPSVSSHTNTPYLQPPQPSVRRRSLSQGDADRIAASNGISNPTFVRLRARRARSTTPDEKRRSGPYAQHRRSASQGPSSRERLSKPPGTPYKAQESPFSGGMLSTPLGTPLQDVMEVVDASGFSEHEDSTPSHYSGWKEEHCPRVGVNPMRRYAKESGPVISKIDHPEALARSKQIIQIGIMAMATQTVPVVVDPELVTEPPPSSSTHHESILQKLEDIEKYLSDEIRCRSSDAMQGCAMIRKALVAKKTEMDLLLLPPRDGQDEQQQQQQQQHDDDDDDALDAPSKVYSEMGCGLYDGSNEDGDELMKLLMQGK